MPNSNNQDQPINFSASHDQASIQEELALKHKKLNEIKSKLDTETQQEKSIKLITAAKQLFNDIQEASKKLSTVQLPTPDEKFKYAKSLLLELLTTNEKNRFKKIEEALSNTCIIKSAGDETIQFQLGILGDAKDNNMIAESEFKYLVVPRLKVNNLLDSYRLCVEGDMILEQTPLEMCQAINKDRSSDTDYEDSKKLFSARLKGIDYELGLKRLKNLENNDSDRDLTKLRQELWSVSSQKDDSSEKDIPEKELSMPEVPTQPLELNSHQPSNEPTININPIEEYQQKSKSEFVAIMEELIPEKKKNKIYINTVQPTSLETIMQASLETSITLTKPEIRTLNFSTIMRTEEIIREGVNQLHESLKNSSSTDGSFIVEEIQRKLGNIEKNRAEKLKKPVPCKLTGEPLVKEYYKIGEVYLINKEKRIVNQQDILKFNKKYKCAEFDNKKPQYYRLNDSQIKKKRDEIYRTMEEALNKDLEKTKKQQALWLGEQTFTQNVEKNGKIKQEKVPFPEKELDFRNLVLDFNSNSASKGKTINVYQGGVYLVSNKKAEPSKIPQISSLRASRICIPGLTSSSASSANLFKKKNESQEYPKLALNMSLKA